jgi:hypothetical protein
MALVFEEGNPSMKGKHGVRSAMFFGFVAEMERKKPRMVHSVLDESKRKVEEFCRHQMLDLSTDAKKELEGAFNSWFFMGLLEGKHPGSYEP